MTTRVKTAALVVVGTVVVNLLSDFLYDALNIGAWADWARISRALPGGLTNGLVAFWQIITGPFGWGLALGSFIFGFWGFWNSLSNSWREQSAYEENKALNSCSFECCPALV